MSNTNIIYRLNDKYNPQTVSDVIVNKDLNIHNNLYKSAFNNYINYLVSKELTTYVLNNDINDDNEIYELKQNIKNNLLSSYKWIKTPNKDAKYYWEPSYVTKIKKSKPFTKEKIYLDLFWDKKYIDNCLTNKIDYETKYNDEFSSMDEVVYYDYINGKATIQNRLTEKTKIIDFSDISDNVKIDKKLLVY